MVDIVRTAKGTATSKVSGTTLALASVEIIAGSSLVVGVTFDAGQGPPVVTWGNRELSRIVLQSQGGASTALFLLRHINNTNTRTITLTWGGAIVAKAMFATMVTGVQIQDVDAKQGQTSTQDPTTGVAATSTEPDTIQISALGSQGPSSDTVGTIGEGHTGGQRAGTTGGGAATNVTVHETYEILSATGDVRAAKTGATSRSWANVILAVKKSFRSNQGITPTDLQAVEDIFETANADYNDVVFKFDPATDEWKAYEVANPGTLRATRSVAGVWS